MGTLEIEVNAELLKAVESLAFRHYGDAGSSSITLVCEAAIVMRLLWLDLLGPGGQEWGSRWLSGGLKVMGHRVKQAPRSGSGYLEGGKKWQEGR